MGYYVCTVSYGTGPGTGLRYCRQRRVEAEMLEGMVLEQIKAFMKAHSERLEDKVTDRLVSDDKFQQMEATLKLELQDTQARAARLFEGFLDGAITKKKFEEANKQLAADEEYVKGKMAEIDSIKRMQRAMRHIDRASMKKVMDNFEYFAGMPFFTKKKLLHQMIKKIIINSRKGVPVRIERIVWREGFD